MIKLIHTFFSFLFVLLMFPTKLFAQTYVPLTKGGIPHMTDMETLTITDMLNIFFGISVAVAAVLAVLMIAIGGFKYMASESALKTSGAKEQISGAIIGLLIVLGAFLILYVINPDIVSLRLFN